MTSDDLLNEVTAESRNGRPKPSGGVRTIVIGGVSVALGATCGKCGLRTRLELGSTPFCQTCRCAGETLQDGDSCSELNES
jgi:hypothetical protein